MELLNDREFFELNGWMRHFLFDESVDVERQDVLSVALRYIALKHKDINGTPAKVEWIWGCPTTSLNGIFSYVERRKKDEDLCVIYEKSSPHLDAPAPWVCLCGAPFPVSEMLSSKFKTQCFINHEAQKCFVLAEGIPESGVLLEWERILVSALFRLLPWRFPGQIDKEDEEYFKGFFKGDKASLLRTKAIEHDVIERGGWKELCYKRLAEKMCTDSSQALITKYKRIESDIRTRIEELFVNLEAQQAHLKETQRLLNSLQIGEFSRGDELLQGIKNKSIRILNVNEDAITFAVCDMLEYYDEDEFFRLEQRSGSYFYRFSDCIQRILHGVFAERLGAFKVSSVFRFNSSKLEPLELHSFVYPRELIEEFLPNPHLYFFKCLGGNAAPILDFLNKGEYDAAIQQTIAATKNINFADSTVISRMGDFISVNIDNPCIVAQDGTVMTIRQFHDTYCKDFQIIPAQS